VGFEEGHGWYAQVMLMAEALLYCIVHRRALVVDFSTLSASLRKSMLRLVRFGLQVEHSAFDAQYDTDEATLLRSFGEVRDDRIVKYPRTRLLTRRILDEYCRLASIVRLFPDQRLTFVLGDLSRRLIQPSDELAAEIDTFWRAHVEANTTVIGVGFRTGTLRNDGARPDLLGLMTDSQQRVLQCALRTAAAQADQRCPAPNRSVRFFVLADDSSTREHALSALPGSFGTKCRAVSFWSVATTEELRCILVDWFLFGRCDEAIATWHSGYQASAMARKPLTPIMMSRNGAVDCIRAQAATFPLPYRDRWVRWSSV
jgi:hypothetical protein